MIRRSLKHLALSLAGLASCSTPTESGPPAVATFVIDVSSELFTVRVATQAQAAELRARMQSGARGVVSGALASGNGGFNAPWRWHMTLTSMSAPDVAIELCDGRPSMVDADLGYWVGTVKQFCPWGARVVREE